MFGTTQMLVSGSVTKHTPTHLDPRNDWALKTWRKPAEELLKYVGPLARGNRGLLRTCLDTLLKFNMVHQKNGTLEVWRFRFWKPSFLGFHVKLGEGHFLKK